ncbi:hypothetical protein NHG29_01360 [Aerococcaceae bacterium NML160702]|nr:hypothetical protein [Aerococcaceae bacterium NML190073]MCW6681514.1 hypothetical protein [Aerococcaceae bacterium NML160702]
MIKVMKEFTELSEKAQKYVLAKAGQMFRRAGIEPTETSLLEEANKCLYDVNGCFECYKDGEECSLFVTA